MKSDSMKSFELIFSFAMLIGLEYMYILDYAIACNKYYNLFIYFIYKLMISLGS